MSSLYLYFLKLFRGIESIDFMAKPMAVFILLVIIFLIAWFAHLFTQKVLISIVKRIAKKTKTEWDDILVKSKVFSGLAHLVPTFIIYYSSSFASPPEILDSFTNDYYVSLELFLLKLAKFYFTAIIVIVINRLLNAVNEIYNTTEYAHHRPIKGYVQLLKILTFFMAGILIVSVLLGKDPTYLLTGLGAMAAVLLMM